MFILATTSLASDDGGATPIEVGGEGANRENETTPFWTAVMPLFDLDAGREVAIQQPASTREMVAQQERRRCNNQPARERRSAGERRWRDKRGEGWYGK